MDGACAFKELELGDGTWVELELDMLLCVDGGDVEELAPGKRGRLAFDPGKRGRLELDPGKRGRLELDPGKRGRLALYPNMFLESCKFGLESGISCGLVTGE